MRNLTEHFITSPPYPEYTRDVLAPYILRSEVPLSEETLELVRSKYIPGTDLIRYKAAFAVDRIIGISTLT
ncbi:hypothetical protein [Bacteroides oleiciplenus]|uniref:Uncharacterized protein n=1 Tax=Bacteroides oleiciplenus TaxID=626931 RepID=A0A3E5AWD2_9BACE|nr:hypothetical protein [Bacteroides oleiciplenus]RGN29641.1 hypothetical protein DXB65_23825 [Bacteroides oleiciplenus]